MWYAYIIIIMNTLVGVKKAELKWPQISSSHECSHTHGVQNLLVLGEYLARGGVTTTLEES